MRVRTLLAALPVALATLASPAFVPAALAADSYPSQNCQTALPTENVANAYAVMGVLAGNEYAFVDVVQRNGAIEVCLRLQHRLGAGYNWEGDYFRFDGVVGSVASVDDNTAACTNVLRDSAVGTPADPYYTPYRVATLGSGVDKSVCINVGAIALRVSWSTAGIVGALPFTASDCCGIYSRAAAFPLGGTESSLCGAPALGSAYVVTQDSKTFVRRDEPTNSICFRTESVLGGLGGRVDTFPAAGYMYVGMDTSMCTEEVYNSGMVPPRYIRIATNPGFGTDTDSYLCVQVNGTQVALHRDPATSPTVPTLHLDI